MSTIQVIPEDIILEYIINKLSSKNLVINFSLKDFKNVSANEFSKLMGFAENIELSEDFFEKYKKIVTSVISRELIKTFNNRSFYIIENEQTKIINITDLDFWQTINFSFNQEAIKVIYTIIFDSLFKIKTECEIVSECDAIFISVLTETKGENYSFQWLLDKNPGWQILTYFLLIKESLAEIHTNFPYSIFLDNYKSIAYPVRFILIEVFAEYYKSLLIEIKNFLVDMQSISIHNSNDLMKKYHTLSNSEKNYMFGRVEEAFNYWCNQGLAFDENNVLRGYAEKYNLLQQIKNLRREIKDIGRIAS